MSRVTRKLLGRNRNKGDQDGTTATADLDEEMEKVFAMSENDKFDFSKFTADGEADEKRERQYNEQEINHSHRKKTYPHIHLPLKGLKSHPWRKSNNFLRSTADKKAENDGDSSTERRNGEASKTETGKLLFYDDSSGEPRLSERAASISGLADVSTDRHVQFIVAVSGTQDSVAQNDEPASYENEKTLLEESHKNLMDHKAKRKHSHHHKKSRKSATDNDDSTREDDGLLDAVGVPHDELEDNATIQLLLQVVEPLQEVVQDDVNSHRLDSVRDKRRFSTKTTSSSLPNKTVVPSVPIKLFKKIFDHSPHEVFVQLDELIGIGDEREWKETARWIKYEEDVEERADRWGRPHVASLTFHSLLNLRRCIETGVVLLDLEEKELPGVAYRVVEQMVVDQVIKESEKSTVMRALLLKHKHVSEYGERFRFMRRNTASYNSLQNLQDNDSKNKNKQHAISMELLKPNNNHCNDGLKSKDFTIDLREETYSSSNEDLDKRIQKERESILKRIPAGAEATTVLVGTVDFLQEPAIAFVRLAEGIFLQSVTEVPIPVRFMFVLLGPLKADVDYHEVGRSMSTLMSNPDFNKEAYKATERRDLLRAINEFLDYSIVLPPDNWERHALLSLRELRAKNEKIRIRRNLLREEATPTKNAVPLLPSEKKDDDPYGDPLRRTKKLFGGLVNDVKRRAPYYKSDILDGLNHHCISVALFMFFAALSAAIAFGGLFARKTNSRIGISETLLSTSACGIVYALFSSQPLLIIGTTGPLLLFDESLYKFCEVNGIEYLTMRFYIGLWLLIIALLVASFEGSVFVKVFTRFTEEIFASLISLIYIYESITMLIGLFSAHPLVGVNQYCVQNHQTHTNATEEDVPDRHHNQPNTALLGLILSLGTFFLAFYLKHFRNSKFLGRNIRRAVGDFGVPISIIVFGALAAAAPDAYTEKLIVPAGLTPTSNRSWLVPVFGVDLNFPYWAALVAVIPAFLVYILVFMETNISQLIIGKKERQLKKGNGFHLDIVLVCLTNVGSAAIGAPWMSGAAVRSLTHVNAVTIMSTTHAPGDKPRIIQVREQRVSGFVCSTLIGLSVLMAPILRLLPMAVLFGVFLYMGIVSISGIQFIERLKLFLMPVKHHPPTAYVRKVPTSKMYLFTCVQLFCVIILWAVKSSAISLLFPFFLLLMIPLRAQLCYFFTPNELRALDSDQPDADDKSDDEPDFYEEAVLPS